MLNHHRPIRVAVLCSHGAPGLIHLLNHSPDRGVAYEIVCCLTSELTFAEEVRVERRGIPVLVHPIAAFFEERGASLYHDARVRASYDAETVDRVTPFFPDLILLDGYEYLVTQPLLKTFRPRILNLHLADLASRHRDGGPRFPGLRAVGDAIAAGCRETRATVHVVNEKVDDGAPIVRSWPFPVSPLIEDLRTREAGEVFKAYVYAHQQWMLRTAAGPLISAALRLISTGAVDLDALGNVEGAATTPWVLDRHGFLLAPEVELAGAAS